MLELNSYPKSFTVGHAYLKDLFSGIVTVEEKIDGSQFSFGVVGSHLQCRSKGQLINIDAPDSLFRGAVETAKELFRAGKLYEGIIFRGEAMCRPKHNVLAYERAPVGNFVLFDVMIGPESYLPPQSRAVLAESMGLEVVKVYHVGLITSAESLAKFMEETSILGGKIEGIVIKNYARFGPDGKILIGKLVSADFKEKHKKEWGASAQTVSKLSTAQVIGNQFRTEARWQKAVQYLRESGQLTNTPGDIPKLLQRVKDDVKEEAWQEISKDLFAWAWPDIARTITNGLPQWWKAQLLSEQSFPDLEQAS